MVECNIYVYLAQSLDNVKRLYEMAETYVNGDPKKFEKAFAEFCVAKTEFRGAIHLAMAALDVDVNEIRNELKRVGADIEAFEIYS